MIKDALENLRNHQEQCDFDGVFVKVSRQALDEVLGAFERTLKPSNRPSLCRNALRDSGQMYPKSGCAICGNGGLMGCPYAR